MSININEHHLGGAHGGAPQGLQGMPFLVKAIQKLFPRFFSDSAYQQIG